MKAISFEIFIVGEIKFLQKHALKNKKMFLFAPFLELKFIMMLEPSKEFEENIWNR